MTDNEFSPIPCALCGERIYGTPLSMTPTVHVCDEVCAEAFDRLSEPMPLPTDDEAAEMADDALEFEDLEIHPMDYSDDADAFRSAGWGTDEDY